MNANKWRKGPQENGYREFYFICSNNREAEAWTISLEYLRTQALYDDFLLNYNTKLSPPKKQKVPRLESSAKSKISAKGSATKEQTVMQGEWEDEEEDRTQFTSPGKRGALKLRKQDDENFSEEFYKKSRSQEKRSFGPNINKDIDIENKDTFRERGLYARGSAKQERSSTSSNRGLNSRIRKKELIKGILGKGQLLIWAHLFSEAGKPFRMREEFGTTPNLLMQKVELAEGLDNFEETITRKSVKLAPSGEKPLRSYFRDDNDEIEDLKKTKPKGNLKIKSSTFEEKKKGEASQLIEVINKGKRGTNTRERGNEEELGLKREEIKVDFAEKGVKRNPKKPNLYGKYKLVTSFFVDSYLDDSLFMSENNAVPKQIKKRRVLNNSNIPYVVEKGINRDYGKTKNAFTLEESSLERSKIIAKDWYAKRNSLEGEQPVYLGNERKAKSIIRHNNVNYIGESSQQSPKSVKFSTEANKAQTEKSWLPSPILKKGLESPSDWQSMAKSPLVQWREDAESSKIEDQELGHKMEAHDQGEAFIQRIKQREKEREIKKGGGQLQTRIENEVQGFQFDRGNGSDKKYTSSRDLIEDYQWKYRKQGEENSLGSKYGNFSFKLKGF